MHDNQVDAYVHALRRGDLEAAVGLLAPDAAFESPFHTWRGKSLCSVYAARSVVFEDITLDALIRDGDRAVILWRATVPGATPAPVQACEVVSLCDGTIGRVGAFLRPAEALPAVHEAMIRAWPAS